MNPKTKIAIAIAVVALIGVGSYIQTEGSTSALCEKFPDLDPKVVRAAHKQMMRAAIRGEYAGVNMDDDDVMTSIFMNIVESL